MNSLTHLPEDERLARFWPCLRGQPKQLQGRPEQAAGGREMLGHPVVEIDLDDGIAVIPGFALRVDDVEGEPEVVGRELLDRRTASGSRGGIRGENSLMGKIMTVENLQAYESGPGANPNWPIADLVYQKVPILSYRNYFCEYDDAQWPLCWDSRRVSFALRLVAEILKSWQAFRPLPAEAVVKKLEPAFPKIVGILQATLYRHAKAGVSSVVPNSPPWREIIVAMAKAVSDVSGAKGIQNPMLGSKVLAFFFPDFFPVWDTAWIKKRGLSQRNASDFDSQIHENLKGDVAAIEYAQYLILMLKEASTVSDELYETLLAECLRQCHVRGYSHHRELIDEFYVDLTPLLFETCLLGSVAGESA